jgi:hypothetical protein
MKGDDILGEFSKGIDTKRKKEETPIIQKQRE